MQVFLSWSGERSKSVATALTKWLPDVFQDLSVWMSAHHIDAGQRWGHELGSQLASTSFGILCLTPDNIESAWLLFEAGALSKVINDAKVVPYLFELSPTDVPFPLAQFQGVEANSDGTFDLLRSINSSLERPLSGDRLERLFVKWWPDLKKALEALPVADSKRPAHRSEREILEELLQTVRTLARSNPAPSPPSATVPAPTPKPNVDLWRGISVWNVQHGDMEKLTLDELQDFRRQAQAAYMEALPDAKESAIQAKIDLADLEIARRSKKDS